MSEPLVSVVIPTIDSRKEYLKKATRIAKEVMWKK